MPTFWAPWPGKSMTLPESVGRAKTAAKGLLPASGMGTLVLSTTVRNLAVHQPSMAA